MCSFALAPLLALAVPAAADSGTSGTDPTATTGAPNTDPATYVAQDTTPSTDPTATDPPTTTVDTTPATDPPTTADTTPATDPPTTVATTPATDPPTTAAPVTSPPSTVDTTPVTAPPDTTPTTSPQAVVPPAGSSGSSGGSASGGSGSASGTGQTGTDVAAAATKPTAAKATSSGGVLPAVSALVTALPQFTLITNPNNNDPFAATIAAPISARQALGPAGRAVESLSAELQQALNPHTDGPWGLGSSAPRLLPWVVLVAVAYLVRMLAAAVLADRTAGPRRRRWTRL